MLDHSPRLVSVIPDVVSKALDAANAHHVDGFVGCFGTRGVVDAWGMLFEGSTGIRDWTQKWVVDYRVRFTDLLHMWDGSSLAVHTQIHGRGYNGPATLTFSLRHSLIDTLQIT